MTFIQDVRFAGRMIAKNPGISAVIVITLAVGIGLNTTVFTLVNAVLLRGLPFEDSETIVHVSGRRRGDLNRRSGVSFPDYRDLRAQATSVTDLAAYTWTTMNVSDGAGLPERYSGARMTANSFRIIGQNVLRGRDFRPDDDKPGAQPVALIGYGVWKNRYGGSDSVLGRTVRINDVPTIIIGIMPEDMRFPQSADMWIPLIPTAAEENREQRALGVYGRLKPEQTLESARAEFNTIATRLESAYASTNKNALFFVQKYNDAVNGGSIRVLFLSLLGAVGCVLLIACANVANLLLSRSFARAREMSIRAALGASRWRVTRQLLTESVLLAFAGGVLGLLLAIGGVRAFDNAVADVGKPYWIKFTFDPTVFAYLAGICLFTGILFGLFPALQGSKADLNTTLKEGGRGSSGSSRNKWVSGGLVVTQLTLAVVLLAGAGLMIRSFFKLYSMNAGIDSAHVMTMRLLLADAKYPKPELRRQFADQLLPKLNNVAGVQKAALASHTPAQGSFEWQIEVEGRPTENQEEKPTTSGIVISPGYFDTLSIALRSGRAFQEADGTAGGQAVIVNAKFASRYWPNEDPIGKRLRKVRDNQPQPWMTVVGVSPDIWHNNPNQPDVDPVIYVPLRQDPSHGMVILARTMMEPASLSTALRAAVQEVDSDLPVYDVRTLVEQNKRQRWAHEVFGTLFAIFAGIALLLSAVGIYAVLAYSVGQRTQEIGIRMALGATATDVMRLVARRGVVQVAVGLIIGLVAAFAVTRVMSALLVQVSPTDPLTFGITLGLLITVGLLAIFLPARRALRVDPLNALRYE